MVYPRPLDSEALYHGAATGGGLVQVFAFLRVLAFVVSLVLGIQFTHQSIHTTWYDVP